MYIHNALNQTISLYTHTYVHRLLCLDNNCCVTVELTSRTEKAKEITPSIVPYTNLFMSANKCFTLSVYTSVNNVYSVSRCLYTQQKLSPSVTQLSIYVFAFQINTVFHKKFVSLNFNFTKYRLIPQTFLYYFSMYGKGS